MYGNGNQTYAPTKAQDVSFAKISGTPDTRLLSSTIADIDQYTERVWKVVATLDGISESMFGENPPQMAEGSAPRPTARADELTYVLAGLNSAVTRLENIAAVFQKL